MNTLCQHTCASWWILVAAVRKCGESWCRCLASQNREERRSWLRSMLRNQQGLGLALPRWLAVGGLRVGTSSPAREKKQIGLWERTLGSSCQGKSNQSHQMGIALTPRDMAESKVAILIQPESYSALFVSN